ncbi:MAG: transpeptidase family protein [Alphaproteobacteria bacterium]|nr:transpeptidase family protein [Alphaproteobacteria bacterium]
MTLEGTLPPELRIEAPDVVRARARRRLWGVGGILLVLLAGVGARGVQLCLLPHEQTITAASTQRWGSVKLAARRGAIYDRNGHRLAASVATPNIVVDPQLVPEEEVDALAAKVARILDMDVADVAERMRRQSRYARLATRVHPSVAARIEELGHLALDVEQGARRYYPEEMLAAQVLGFVDAAGRGRAGLEKQLDEQLRGGSLLLQRRRDLRGYSIDGQRTRDDMMGMDVHTTLDRQIQRMAERALEGVIERSDPVAASIIVLDHKTGDVLAMANAPTFNPNAVEEDPAPRRNHAVQDAIEPGSVLKPFNVAAAIEEGLVSIDSSIDCEGGSYRIGRARIHDDHPHNVVTVGEVIKYSSNIGSAKLAIRLGAEKFTDYMRAFGFTRRTGLPLPGERAGIIRSPERIKPIELATTSYGQGMTATPLQVAAATATLANGGVRMRPRLVSRIEDVHGVPEVIKEPMAEARVISEKTAKDVARAMVTVTEQGGTATRARVPGYLVAGKTGTAEKVVDGKYSASARIGSFMGFIPADDPAITVVVVVDQPRKGSRYGGSVAGPAFAELAGAAMRYLNIPPDPELLGEPIGPGPIEPLEDPGPLRVAWSGSEWTVPDFAGRSVRDVLRGVQGTGLGVELKGSGVVVAQAPPAGARLAPGEKVSVTFQ